MALKEYLKMKKMEFEKKEIDKLQEKSEEQKRKAKLSQVRLNLLQDIEESEKVLMKEKNLKLDIKEKQNSPGEHNGHGLMDTLRDLKKQFGNPSIMGNNLNHVDDDFSIFNTNKNNKSNKKKEYNIITGEFE